MSGNFWSTIASGALNGVMVGVGNEISNEMNKPHKKKDKGNKNDHNHSASPTLSVTPTTPTSTFTPNPTSNVTPTSTIHTSKETSSTIEEYQNVANNRLHGTNGLVESGAGEPASALGIGDNGGSELQISNIDNLTANGTILLPISKSAGLTNLTSANENENGEMIPIPNPTNVTNLAWTFGSGTLTPISHTSDLTNVTVSTGSGTEEVLIPNLNAVGLTNLTNIASTNGTGPQSMKLRPRAVQVPLELGEEKNRFTRVEEQVRTFFRVVTWICDC